MKKVIRLTESDLNRIVKRVIKEGRHNDMVGQENYDAAFKAMSDYMEGSKYWAMGENKTKNPTRGMVRQSFLENGDYSQMLRHFEKEFNLSDEEVVDLFSDYLETFPKD